jgi:hypothetical protein
MDKAQYSFGIVLLLAEVIIVILMATTADYHQHAKATDSIGNNNAHFLKNYRGEENIFRKKHPGKCLEMCGNVSRSLLNKSRLENLPLKAYELMAVQV